jgi:hypothetical protein
VLGDHDASRCLVVGDELAAEIAEPDSLLAHGIVLLVAVAGCGPAARGSGCRDIWNATSTLPHRTAAVKYVFD